MKVECKKCGTIQELTDPYAVGTPSWEKCQTIEYVDTCMKCRDINIKPISIGSLNLFFVDCEAGDSLYDSRLTEFGAAHYPSGDTFHGILIDEGKELETFEGFDKWIKQHTDKRAIFVSDNPAYDWQWINYGFHKYLGYNPFGHSARRIGDFYAGLMGDFTQTQAWKKLRITKHDHNPVHDAVGNLEAFERLLRGER